MRERSKLLILTALSMIVILYVGSCTQPDDVMAPVSRTELALSPERLPTLPDGYVYAIWSIDTLDNARPIGQFKWNNDYYKFYDLNDNEIDSTWISDFNLLDPYFRYLAVSVETAGSIPAGSVLPVDQVGPIMLRGEIVAPEVAEMKLVFPVDMWLGYGYYCVETPTDGNSDSLDACGIWFAEYLYDSILVSDTLNVRLTLPPGGISERPLIIDILEADTVCFKCTEYYGSGSNAFCIDSVEIDCSEYDPNNDSCFFNVDILATDTMAVVYYSADEADTISLAELAEVLDTVRITNVTQVTNEHYRLTDTLVIDTFVHTNLTFDYIAYPVNTTDTNQKVIDTLSLLAPTTFERIEVIDTFTIMPFTSYEHDLNYTIDSAAFMVDKFLTSFEESPDLSDTKWHYKGWVLSPYLMPKEDFGSLTRPGWSTFFVAKELRPVDGSMITTGSFKSFLGPDDGNPYSDNKRVPMRPGEDFIQNLPNGASALWLADPVDSTRAAGTVIVTLEPDNYDNDSTNFPLILFSGHIPPYVEVTRRTDHYQNYNRPALGYGFELKNWSMAVDEGPLGSGTGFPAIKVAIGGR